MKLNNRGWGTKDLIISGVVIMILLLIVVFNVNRLYKSLELEQTASSPYTKINEKVEDKIEKRKKYTNTENEDNNEQPNDNTEDNPNYELSEMDLEYYKNYETRLQDSTRKYIIDTNYQVNGEQDLINLNDLIDGGYISELHDINDNSICNGYSIVQLLEDNRISIKPYIICTSYKTEGV